jgi:hypothetical protein
MLTQSVITFSIKMPFLVPIGLLSFVPLSRTDADRIRIHFDFGDRGNLSDGSPKS